MTGAAVAACPVSSDLTQGVRVEYADGYSIITRDDSGVVTEEEHTSGDVYRYVTDNGLLETAYIDDAAGVADTFDYTFDTTALFPLRPWTGQRGEQIIRNSAGEEVERVSFAYSTRGERIYRIGDCFYAAMGFQTFAYYPDETSMVEFMYLIDLAVPVPIGFGGGGNFDNYRPLSISVEGE